MIFMIVILEIICKNSGVYIVYFNFSKEHMDKNHRLYILLKKTIVYALIKCYNVKGNEIWFS